MFHMSLHCFFFCLGLTVGNTFLPSHYHGRMLRYLTPSRSGTSKGLGQFNARPCEDSFVISNFLRCLCLLYHSCNSFVRRSWCSADPGLASSDKYIFNPHRFRPQAIPGDTRFVLVPKNTKKKKSQSPSPHGAKKGQKKGFGFGRNRTSVTNSTRKQTRQESKVQ
jgi:hypothetical protein